MAKEGRKVRKEGEAARWERGKEGGEGRYGRRAGKERRTVEKEDEDNR